jgi:hypothetical protein
LKWDPFLKEARLLDDETCAGRGVKTLCSSKTHLGRLQMETVYVTFIPPRVAAVKMLQGPRMLKSFAASLRQEQMGTDTTRVIYRYNFNLRPRWAAPVLNPIFRALFSRQTRRRLHALKQAIEPA